MGQIVIDKIGKRRIVLWGIFFIAGIITHLGMLVYQVESVDSNSAGLFHYTPDWETTLGRWLIQFLDGTRYYISSPFFLGVIYFSILSVGIVILLENIGIDDILFQIILGVFFIVIPPISNTFMFLYCADSYAVSMLFSQLFVLVIRKQSSIRHFLVASFMLMISMALYQAYVGMAAITCLIILITMLLCDEKVNDVIKKALYMIGSALAGAGIYYVATIGILKYKGLAFAEYGGANSLSNTSILDIKIAIALAYQKFIELFFGTLKITYHSFFRGAYYSILLCVIFISVLTYYLIKKKSYKNVTTMIGIGGLILLLPLAAGVVLFVVKGHGLHILMCHGYYEIVLLIGTLLCLLLKTENSKIVYIVSSAYLVIVSLLGLEYFAMDNATYEYTNMRRLNMISTAERILGHVEDMDGYSDDTEFVIAGRLLDGYEVETYLEKMAFLETETLFTSDYESNKAITENIYREGLGTSLKFCDDITYLKVIDSENFKNMPVYPEKGSIIIENNLAIVKLSEEPFVPSSH